MRLSPLFRCGVGLWPAAFLLIAHDVITTKLTWNREISRVVYKRCASCHRDGGAAMSLLTYDEARPWAKAIRDQVVARTMPPWGAVKGVGSFQNDPSLTEVEIQMIVAWVEGGAPKGDDDSIAPKRPPAGKVTAKVASAPRATARPPARKVEPVAGELQLDHPMVLLGVRPESLDEGQSMLVDAWFPDGRIEHLIWLRDYRMSWSRDYLFRTPLKLPAGTTIHVKTPGQAKVLLLL
jgi:mono/diheme cytochrome c family protein